MLLTIVAFVIILSILVLIHEAGHFITAKLFGIKVEEFGFGIPPRAFGIKFGETLYSINWLPVGGFVKLYGEDEAGSGRIQSTESRPTKNLHRAFFSRPIWQRATVVVAGVVMNFLLAAVLLSVLFAFVGVPALGDKVNIDAVISGSPAQKAGFKEGDLIEAINGKQIKSVDEVLSSSKENGGKEQVQAAEQRSGCHSGALV